MKLFRVTVNFFVSAHSKSGAEESVIKLIGTNWHDSMTTEDVTCLPSLDELQQHQDAEIAF
jgi:hypothetical protein